MCQLTVGSPVAGTIFDRTGSYTLVFVIAGLSPVIAAISMFLTRCVADDSAIGQRDLEAWTAKTAWTDDGGAPGAATASELEVLDRKASLANAGTPLIKQHLSSMLRRYNATQSQICHVINVAAEWSVVKR